MSLYDEINARDHAVALVSKALESGAIKLGGPSSAGKSSFAGELDAEYLASLIKVLKNRLHE